MWVFTNLPTLCFQNVFCCSSLFINRHPPTPLFFIFNPKDLWIILIAVILILTQPTILTVFIWHEARIFQGTVIQKKHKKKAHTRDRIFQYPESQQPFKIGFVKRKKRNRFSKFFSSLSTNICKKLSGDNTSQRWICIMCSPTKRVRKESSRLWA